jgi:hypothetical protein
VNKLTKVIGEFQWEIKAVIPRIIKLFTERSEHARSGALIVIGSFVTQGQWPLDEVH